MREAKLKIYPHQKDSNVRNKMKTHNTGFTLNLQLKHTHVLTPYPGPLQRNLYLSARWPSLNWLACAVISLYILLPTPRSNITHRGVKWLTTKRKLPYNLSNLTWNLHQNVADKSTNTYMKLQHACSLDKKAIAEKIWTGYYVT